AVACRERALGEHVVAEHHPPLHQLRMVRKRREDVDGVVADERARLVVPGVFRFRREPGRLFGARHQSFTTSLPKFSPVKSMFTAVGADRNPSTTCTRFCSLPSPAHTASWIAASANRSR